MPTIIMIIILMMIMETKGDDNWTKHDNGLNGGSDDGDDTSCG